MLGRTAVDVFYLASFRPFNEVNSRPKKKEKESTQKLNTPNNELEIINNGNIAVVETRDSDFKKRKAVVEI